MLTVNNINIVHESEQIQSVSMVDVLLQHSTTDLVSNVKTRIVPFSLNNEVWPLTINNAEYNNALICSPYTTYVTYGLHELKRFSKLWIKLAVLCNVALMSCLCRLTKINKIVIVNNNLNSLLKHPSIFTEKLPEITQRLISDYPSHAITFFRVNDVLDEKFKIALKKQGFLLFPDRTAHLFFLHKAVMERTDTKRDLGLLGQSPYSRVSHDALRPHDAERFAELYYQLFIEKHSTCNPIYTAAYFRLALKHRWHVYTALRNSDGRIDGFVSWFVVGDILIAGPMGYDRSVNIKVGLYRQLVAIYLKHANDNKYIFNMGGGSDTFKKNRGSTPVLEYTAVYCKHLPRYRQIPWKIFQWLFNKMLKKIFSESSL